MAGGRITAVQTAPSPSRAAEPGETTYDAEGLLLAPGFVDLQINGAFGHDFTQDPASIWQAAARLPRYGVTAFLPTIITSPTSTIKAAQAVLRQVPAQFSGAWPLGLHLEGPFLNPQKKGAHNPAHLQAPDTALASTWSPQSGVRLVTLAPELTGALDVIRLLAGNGVLVSAGHSMATLDEANVALDAGLRYGTHLFNAMPALHHREPGLVAALLDDERAAAGLIVDGIHVHPALIRLIWQLLGPQRLALVSDAMAALGMMPGQRDDRGVFHLGDQAVHVEGLRATLPDGTLAGSILSLDTACGNLMQFSGCSLPEALQTVTLTPMRLLQLDDRKGRVAPGYDADLVLLTTDCQVAATFVGGRLVYENYEHTNHRHPALSRDSRTT